MRTRTLWKAVWPCRLGADPAPPLSPPRPRTRAARDGIGWDLRCGSDPTRQRRGTARGPSAGERTGSGIQACRTRTESTEPSRGGVGAPRRRRHERRTRAARSVCPVRLPARGVQEQSRASVAAEVGAAVILARWRRSTATGQEGILRGARNSASSSRSWYPATHSTHVTIYPNVSGLCPCNLFIVRTLCLNLKPKHNGCGGSSRPLSLFLFRELIERQERCSHTPVSQNGMNGDHSPCGIKIMAKQATPAARYDTANGYRRPKRSMVTRMTKAAGNSMREEYKKSR